MGVFVIRKKHMGAAAPMTRLQRLNAPETTSRPEPHPSAYCPQPARSYARASSQVRRAVAAKPSLADLAGVQPSDSEEPLNRSRRDKPRIIFQPIHAVIAMLTLTCALCASLTMLIQQATHYAQLQSTQPTVRQTAHPSSGTSPSTSASSAQPDTARSESTDTDPTSDLLDLNTAGLEELQTLKGIGPVTAQRILDYRMQFGRFDKVDQLMEVKGIGSKTLAKFRDQVCVR